MHIGVLGTLELTGEEPVTAVSPHPVGLRSPKLRRLLAGLLVQADAVVSVHRLADILWGDEQPASPAAAVQTLVSRLRNELRATGLEGEVDLLTRAPGYLLRVPREVCDATRFEDLVAAARQHLDRDPATASRLLDDALGAWRGPAYAEFAEEEFARAEAARLEELRLTAVEDRIEAALRLGRHDAAVGELEALVAEHPLRERPRAQLMLALHRSGRSVEALQAYRAYREQLADDLGLEPSAALRALETGIIRQDPSLALAQQMPASSAASTGGSGTAPAPDDAPAAPPVQPADRAFGNLPLQLTTLVGREKDLCDIAEGLERSRVVTLIGVGGVGKTRLALQAAADARPAFPDGTWVCELAAVDLPPDVEQVVATVLGVQQRQGLTSLERLVEFLRPKRLLLVVDNCEHVLAAAAQLVNAVVRGCPAISVLATSREPLGLDGEQVYPIPPLPVPGPSTVGTADSAARVPSITLFTERARAASPGFMLTDDNAGAVAEICRRLDGVPLALELAATRVRSMTPADLAERLQARFRLLRSGRRIAQERHRTLRSVVDWSYSLLTPEERAVFDRLSVFAGTFTLTAAERVATSDTVGAADVADLLISLVDKSMVVAHIDDGETRYTLLETLRDYGRERLTESGWADNVRRTHALRAVEFAEEAGQHLRGPAERGWAEAVNQELDELRTAHAWALMNDLGLALRLSAALIWFAESWIISEVFSWAERTVEAAEGAGFSHPLLPLVYAAAAGGERFRGDFGRAVALAERGLAATSGEDDPARAYLLVALAEIAIFQGRLDEAFRLGGEAVQISLATGDPGWAVYALADQVLARAYAGDSADALALADQAQRLAEITGNPTARAWARYAAGETLLDKDPDRAIVLLEEALAYAEAAGNRFVRGVALVSAASLRGRRGDPQVALLLFREVIEHWHRAGNWTQQWTTLRNAIEILARVGADAPAATLYGAMTVSGTAVPAFGIDTERLATAVRMLKTRLGEKAFAAAHDRGTLLNDDDAVNLACTAIDIALAATP